ncbi:Hypothetical protein, putative, partial [Bodo saltans]
KKEFANTREMRKATAAAMSSSSAPILFNKINEPFGCMSNFSPHSIVVDGLSYRTTEHFFQAMKFAPTPAVAEEIRNTKSPMCAAMAGRSRSRPLRKDWEALKDVVMEVALLCKFSQHHDLQGLLISTGSRKIVEHTARDKYWGDGGDKGTGTIGKNRLGFLLEKVRSYFLSPEGRSAAQVSDLTEELMKRIRCVAATPRPADGGESLVLSKKRMREE